jgi:hypothetical protein
MPMHDWTRASAGDWHSFEFSWRCAISNHLTRSGLSQKYFSMITKLELRPETGFYEMQEPEKPNKLPPDDDTAELPSRLQAIPSIHEANYATDFLAIRESCFHTIKAAIFLVSKQDATVPYRKRALVQSAVGALTRGINVVVIDLCTNHRQPSDTISEAIWRELGNPPWERPVEASTSAVSFRTDFSVEAYLEPLRVGEVLPEIPLFLGRDLFVLLPLEATYAATWTMTPEPTRQALEATTPNEQEK